MPKDQGSHNSTKRIYLSSSLQLLCVSNLSALISSRNEKRGLRLPIPIRLIDICTQRWPTTKSEGIASGRKWRQRQQVVARTQWTPANASKVSGHQKEIARCYLSWPVLQLAASSAHLSARGSHNNNLRLFSGTSTDLLLKSRGAVAV